MLTPLRRAVILLVAAVLVPAAPAHAATVRGWVALHGPASGGQVTIVSLGGRTLARDADGPSRHGVFRIDGVRLPHAYRVVVRGARADGRRVPEPLTAVVSGLRSGEDIYVNAATTLIDEVARHRAGAALRRATARARRYLELPDAHDLGEDMRVTERWIDDHALLDEAARHGGMRAFARGLPRAHPHRLVAAPVRAVAAQASVTPADIAQAFAIGAAREAGGMGLSSLLSLLGSGDDSSLAAVSAQLDEIIHQLDEISGQLTEIDVEIRDLLKEEGQQTLSDIAKSLHSTSIEDRIDTLHKVATEGYYGEAEREKLAAGLIADIAADSDFRKLPTDYGDAFTGAHGVEPLMRRVGRIAHTKSPLDPFATSATSDAIDASFEDYKLLQLEGTILLNEFYASQQLPQTAQDVLSGYIASYPADAATQPAPIPPGFVVDTATGLAWLDAADGDGVPGDLLAGYAAALRTGKCAPCSVRLNGGPTISLSKATQSAGAAAAKTLAALGSRTFAYPSKAELDALGVQLRHQDKRTGIPFQHAPIGGPVWADEKPSCQPVSDGSLIPTERCRQPTVDLTTGDVHAVNVKACMEINTFCGPNGLAIVGGMPAKHVLWRADVSGANLYVP
jgi:hypothetical protein